MSDNSPLSEFMLAKDSFETYQSLPRKIIFSKEFYDTIKNGIHVSNNEPKYSYGFQGLCDGVPFYINPLMKNRWLIVMSDGTLQFSNDGENT